MVALFNPNPGCYNGKVNGDSGIPQCSLSGQEIVERMPADPFEAELLMMAEAVATAGKDDSSESEEEDSECPRQQRGGEGTSSSQNWFVEYQKWKQHNKEYFVPQNRSMNSRFHSDGHTALGHVVPFSQSHCY